MNKEKERTTEPLPGVVLEAHQNLNHKVDTISQIVHKLLLDSQAHFLYAYRIHLQKITKQLEQIKEKSLANQKLFSTDARINHLETQAAIFRQQALRSYKIQDQTKAQLEFFKNKSELTEAELLQLQEMNKRKTKACKDLNAELTAAKAKISDITRQMELLRGQNQDLRERVSILQEREQTNKVQLRQTQLEAKPKQQRARVKSVIKYQSKPLATELQNIFLTCVESVHKDIGRRTNFDRPISEEQFLNCDKKRLMFKLLTNEQALKIIFQSMFRNRDRGNSDFVRQDLNQTEVQLAQEQLMEGVAAEKSERKMLIRKRRKQRREITEKVAVVNGRLVYKPY